MGPIFFDFSINFSEKQKEKNIMDLGNHCLSETDNIDL